MKKNKIILYIITVLCLLCTITYFWFSSLLNKQRLPEDYWKSYSTAKVSFNDYGIPTIKASNWEDLIKAQGFVIASERLWQMDLLRRKSSGKLSEWFGHAAFENDKNMQSENRIAIADAAVQNLPMIEKKYCQLYADGINQFISDHKNHWGIEYFLLRSTPQPWSCRDSILILMLMNSQLTSAEDFKTSTISWSQYLPLPWTKFIFPNDHRWNQPIFGKANKSGPKFPSKEFWLPKTPLHVLLGKNVIIKDSPALGSNNWAYRSEHEHFLLNDPHLKQSVPGIWYASKLFINAKQWTAGVSVPGIPGIILGMNPHIAWSFTNTGEDVDELIEETISEDQKSYLYDHDQSEKVWATLDKKEFHIKIKGENKPIVVSSLWTHRGQLKQYNFLPNRYFSRRWLNHQKKFLRLPIIKFMTMKNFDEAHTAFNDLTTPSQNIISLDRDGNILYRTSGVHIKRFNSKDIPTFQNSLDEPWEILKSEQKSHRPNLFIKNTSPDFFLATANERIWTDHHYHYWSSDDRKRRISEVLSRSTKLTQDDMDQLVLDSTSKFRKLLLSWIAKNSLNNKEKISKKISAWDGSSKNNPELFYQSSIAEQTLVKILLSQLIHHYFPEDQAQVAYKSRMQRAWLLEVLMEDQSLEPFGLDSTEVANYLLSKISDQRKKHHIHNKWKAQHPFVHAIPVIGKFFAVPEYPQYGSFDCVNAEQPLVGPSVRMLWNMSQPEKSTWILPVGQSGHTGSDHYRNMQSLWHQGKKIPVFEENEVTDFFSDTKTK